MSDACRLKQFSFMTKEQYAKKLGTTKYNSFLLQKPYQTRNNKALIRPTLPNPMPKECISKAQDLVSCKHIVWNSYS